MYYFYCQNLDWIKLNFNQSEAFRRGRKQEVPFTVTLPLLLAVPNWFLATQV